MPRIRLNLKNLTVTEKIAKGRQIVTAMTNNASFPTPMLGHRARGITARYDRSPVMPLFVRCFSI
jgi:hypothetical protein